jgi:hypothetical protein
MATRLAIPAILIGALAIRMPFAFLDPVVITDPHVIAGWATSLASGGISGLLDSTSNVVYPPLALLALWLVGLLREPLVGMRLMGILGDVCLAAVVAVLVRGHRPRVRIAIVASIAFNPALWYLSAIWGQLDSVYALLGVVSLGWLAGGRRVPAAAAEGFSIAWKLQGLVIAPVVAAVVLRGRRLSTIVAAAAAAVVAVTISAVALSAVAGFDPRYIARLWPSATPANISAFNVWYVATLVPHGLHPSSAAPSAVSSNSAAAGLIGVAAVGVVTLVVCVALFRMRDEPRLPLLALAGATLTIGAFVFLAGMHERYLVAAIPLLALAAAGAGTGQIDRGAAVAFVAITVTQTLNLLAVGSFATNLWVDIFAGRTGPLAPAFVALGVVSVVVNVAVLGWCLWRFTVLGAGTFPALGRFGLRSRAS